LASPIPPDFSLLERPADEVLAGQGRFKRVVPAVRWGKRLRRENRTLVESFGERPWPRTLVARPQEIIGISIVQRRRLQISCPS
jgi:hypothetical protein